MSIAASPGADWRMRLIGLLGHPAAKRICQTSDLEALIKDVRPTAADQTVRLAIEGLVQAGALRKVSRGVYLNQRTTPPAEIEEAVPLVRAGAIVSLQSVLGRVGVLNNIPDRKVAYAVLDTSKQARPNLGRIDTQEGGFIMVRGLAARFFPHTPDEERMLLVNGAQVPTFRPEAAFLQWLYLARNMRSDLEPPPVDVDLSLLDESVLSDLAARWELKGELASWRLQAKARAHGEEASTVPAAPTEDKREAAADARARLMARGTRPR